MLTLLWNITKSVFVGLLVGVVLIIVVPSLRPSGDLNFRNWLFANSAELSFSSAVRKAGPAVVNIYSTRLSLDPLNRVKRTPKNLGSGVIMDSAGVVMTNYHVIKGANQVEVALQDGRVFYARLLGVDLLTDMAALHIEAEVLPVIPMDLEGNSQVGDIVLAIGNPFNLGQTITQGIISRTGGNAGLSSQDYVDLLQTDAAINAGNSGGALINSRGEMIGINTSNFASGESGATHGISFAIPVKLAYTIMTKLVKDGTVTRGYLGFTGDELNPVQSQSVLSEFDKAIQVDSVSPSGPAYQAGLRVGDLVVRVNEQVIKNLKQARHQIAETTPGETISLTVIRDNSTLELSPVVAELSVQ